MTDLAPALSPAEAAEQLDDHWQVVDVRLEYERVEGRIAGDLHIQLTELSVRFGEIDATRPVLVYCRSGSRSEMAVAALRGAGYDAHNLEGGMLAWTEAGLPVVSGPDAA